MNISSSFDHLVQPSTQQAIENAAVNHGAESVSLIWANENTDDGPIYDMYDENEYYIASIDTDGDVVFDR
jgi:hypothetical protein